MNYILEYHKKISNGVITTSKKVKIQYEMLADLINEPETNYIKEVEEVNGELVEVNKYYEYDQSYAQHVIDFIERFCVHIKGPLAGKPIILELWQKAFIAALYGFVDKKTGFRRFQRIHLYVARKNGKTILAACIIIYELIAGGEQGAECYTSASKRDQAKIAWDMAKMIIQRSPLLDKRFNCIREGIFTLPYQDSFFKALSKESKKQDGANAHISHVDELHAITDMNIIDVMWDSSKTREQPIEIITTTMGMERMSVFDEIYDYDSNVLAGTINDQRLLVFCYELDNINEWKDIKNAWKSNPNLGISQSINKLHEEIEKAKGDKKKLKNLLTKSFNVAQNNRLAWLDMQDIKNDAVVDLKKYEGAVVIGGLDLSRVNDLTAFNTLIVDNDSGKKIAITKYWCTQKWYNKVLEANKLPVDIWLKKGFISIAGHGIIDYKQIVEYILGMINEHGFTYQYIGYDPYSAPMLIQELASEGFSEKYCLNKVYQGYNTLSIPLQVLENDMKKDDLIYQNNPITKWNFLNADIVMDDHQNIKVDKSSSDRKIDGVIAIANCYVEYLRNKGVFDDSEY